MAKLIKPSVDTKGGDLVTSRIGASREVDILIGPEESFFDYLKNYADLRCLVIDEAQFLMERQVLELVLITKEWNIPVICYGLKVDFQGKLFKGSETLIRYADSLQELIAICDCGRKARFNARKVNDEYVYDGDQIIIGTDEIYDPLCEICFLNN